MVIDIVASTVISCANSICGDVPYLFRTFATSARPGSKGYYGEAQKLPIWQVARATSAAPGYFRPMRIKKGDSSESVTFKDGGFGTNNPSVTGYKDTINKHGGHTRSIGPFVSLGTGEEPLEKFPQDAKTFKHVRDAYANLKSAVQMASRGITADVVMQDNANLHQFPYFRFDGGNELGKIGLGEWKTHRFAKITGHSGVSGFITLEKIRETTRAYLRSPGVQNDLTRCAEILVERRRFRTRDASAWDRYASFSYYECKFDDCPQRRINTLREFKQHVLSVHSSTAHHESHDEALAKYRKVDWIYGKNTAATTA